MGFSLTWVAARGKSRDRVLVDLNLEGTDEWEESPESPIAGAQIPGGWYGVIVNGRDVDLTEDGALQRLATGAEVVLCTVDEQSRCSAASGWKNGQEIWSVIRDPEKNAEEVIATGKLPRPYPSVVKELRAQQQAEVGMISRVDYLFETPVELAKALVGYRYDREIPGVTGAQFEVLAVRKKAGRYFMRWDR